MDKTRGMQLSTFSATTKEVFIDAETVNITATQWSNLDGCSLMVHGNGEGLPLRMAGAFRWDEIDAIIAALAAIRAA